MLQLGLPRDPAAPLTLLCLGAHSDDIEIGCGGTVLQLLSARSNLRVVWVVFSSAGEREREARTSASLFLQQARAQEVIVMNFRDGFFPYQGADIKESFEELKINVDPDLIFTHYRDDRHQDHRTISELTWNTWRRHLILEYEIPKYDGDLGAPNCFVPLKKEVCARKIKNICDVFKSESNKAWMTEDTFRAILRLRGVECAAPDQYAEAFYCRKLILGTELSNEN
ncbi:PIG-L deacetylase family protein [Caenimonas soli]|uniref:PIG-L deacetylase family protein n=1 Tax=Caenimonas soli TaxID=2735555 RepID=UPI001555EF2A|nr:PIG-L deacetylase family protein [Caenimonas soli]NPC55546.1 PIG-L family deacetylase [Caenimonas soli]